MEVCSTTVNENNGFISGDISSVSENVQECRDEEACNRRDENIEKTTVCDTMSQDREDCIGECSKGTKLGANSECSDENNGVATRENVEMENENDNIVARNNGDVNNDNINERTLSRRFLDLIDEDSDEEIISCKKNFKTGETRKIINSESEEDLQIDEDIPQTIHKITADSTISNYRTLLNSDSEEERKETTENSFSFDNVPRDKNVKQKSVKKKKKKKGSIRASKEEAMRKIYSESQRLLREANISLPYHRPKQRTLQEFLNRRKISAALPKASSTAAKLKMSSTIVSRVLAEKEKEAKRFYKSSDSEDDAQQLVSFGNKNIEKSSAADEEVPLTNVGLTRVQDPRKTGISNHRFHLESDSGIPVEKDLNKGNEDKEVPPLIGNSVTRYNVLLTQEITNESMQNIRSISRRLFENSEDNTNRVSDHVTRNHQRTLEKIRETAVTSVDNGESINKERKSEFNETDRIIEISDSQRCDSDVTNKHSKTRVDNTSNKETTLENNVTTTNSDDCIVTEDGNDGNREKRNETDNVSSSSSVSLNNALSETQINCSAENCKNNGCVFGLPLPKFTDDVSTVRKRFPPESNSEVRLKGLPGMIINLTEDTKSSGKNVNTLLNRFFSKHLVGTKRQPDGKPEVTAIHLEDTPNGPLPVKETVPYKIPVDTDKSELSKPGAKLTRLKEDLKLQMIIKRNEEWKQKEIEQRYEEKWDEEDEDCYGLMGDSSYEQKQLGLMVDSGESEPEENDVCIKDKKRRAYLFADDEAEVTDDEEESDAESDAEDGNEQSASFKRKRKSDVNDTEIDKEEEEETDEDDAEDDKSECDSKSDDANVRKNEKDERTKLSMREGSQDEDSSITASSCVGSDGYRLKNITTENENDTPVYQQQAEVTTRTQECKTPFAKTSMLDFISPVTQLSVLNITVNSAKKSSSKKTGHPDDRSFVESTRSNESPVQINGTKTFAKKRLFDDTDETIDDEYLMRLCSGKFGSTRNTASNLGDFSSQFVYAKRPENTDTSQNVTTVDEDFDNSVKRSEVSAINKELKLTIISSDDEDHSDEADTFLKPKKRPLKRLSLSDSEEESAESSDKENSDIENEEEKRYVDYDSEENEVIVAEKDIKKVAARFVEEEAELSESDWDSADEDERDLDKLDFEEGDNEQLDEHEIRDQLGKMRMKQMLDEDKRDVRLLKELLFEDGDLYTDGAGRERKFKWKNVDKLGNTTETSGLLDERDNWVDERDHEEEAEWHKLRQERDKFLEEKMKSSKNELEDELRDSYIFKPLKKIRHHESQGQSVSPDKADPSENMEPIMPRNLTDLLNGPSVGKKSRVIYNITKKSSFLTRGEESLARIASLAKQGDSHALNTRNFVFRYISPDSTSKEDTTEELDLKNESKKRKTTSNLSSTTKKRRR